MSDFIPYTVILEVGSIDTYAAFLKCFIKSEQDENKLRQSNFKWRTTGAKSAPLQLGGYTQLNWRKSAPVAFVTGATKVQLGIKPPPSRFEWRTPEGEKMKLETELSELRELISETAGILSAYDRLLAPYWHAKGDIEDAVRRTHGRGYANVLVFNPDKASDRQPRFEELMALAVEWGPTKAERSGVQTRISGYEREAKKIETELKRMATKKVKKNGKA